VLWYIEFEVSRYGETPERTVTVPDDRRLTKQRKKHDSLIELSGLFVGVHVCVLVTLSLGCKRLGIFLIPAARSLFAWRNKMEVQRFVIS